VFTLARVSMITYRVDVYRSRPIGASLLCLGGHGLHCSSIVYTPNEESETPAHTNAYCTAPFVQPTFQIRGDAVAIDLTRSCLGRQTTAALDDVTSRVTIINYQFRSPLIAQAFSAAYIGQSDVAVICCHITISMLWGNSAYCVKLSGEDLWRYWNKIESVRLRKCPYYHYVNSNFV